MRVAVAVVVAVMTAVAVAVVPGVGVTVAKAGSGEGVAALTDGVTDAPVIPQALKLHAEKSAATTTIAEVYLCSKYLICSDEFCRSRRSFNPWV